MEESEVTEKREEGTEKIIHHERKRDSMRQRANKRWQVSGKLQKEARGDQSNRKRGLS
jgi:hypothetical protein